MSKRARALARIDNTADGRPWPRVELECIDQPAPCGEDPGECAAPAASEPPLSKTKARHVRIVEHQSQSGLTYRPPIEHLRAARLDLGASTVDVSLGAVQVASVFSDTADWAAGEFIVSHMAVKPWRNTLEGTVALRVLEGSAWLCMMPDDSSDGSGAADELPAPSPSGPAAELGGSLAGEPPHLDESRLLCAGDWVCLPSRVRYQISGCGLYDDAWHKRTAENVGPPFRAAYFARVYGEARPSRWNQYYEDPFPNKHEPKDEWLEGARAGRNKAAPIVTTAGEDDGSVLDGTGRTPSPIKKAKGPRSKGRATDAI